MTEDTLYGRVCSKMVEAGLITKEQLAAAEEHSAKTGKRLKDIIPGIALITSEDMGRFLEEKLDVPRVDLESYSPEPEAIRALSGDVARENGILPLFEIEGILTVVLADALDVFELDALSRQVGWSLEPALSADGNVQETIEACYSDSEGGAEQPSAEEAAEGDEEEAVPLNDELEPLPDLEDLPNVEVVTDGMNGIELDKLAVADDETVKGLIGQIVNEAASRGATSIHIEPRRDLFHLFFRIDGELSEVASAAAALQTRLVSRLMRMARLEGSADQGVRNGGLSLIVDERERAVSISVCATSTGPRVVIGLESLVREPIELARLGFVPEDLTKLQLMLDLPTGFILIAGPLASGKTTTLFSCLASLASSGKSVFAVTERMECAHEAINQIVVGSDPSYRFSSILRSLARQDCDVLGVDEIRDLEVAGLAAKAAKSDMLTLATTLARDATAAPSGLIWMGLEPVSLAQVLSGVIAQVPVRLICEDCKVEDKSEVALKAMEALGGPMPYTGAGCAKCDGTGYKGSAMLYELLVAGDKLRTAVSLDKPEGEIRELAKESGMTSMRLAGLRRVAEGLTSVAEVRRVTRLGGA